MGALCCCEIKHGRLRKQCSTLSPNVALVAKYFTWCFQNCSTHSKIMEGACLNMGLYASLKYSDK